MARDRLTALQVKRAHDKGEPVLLPDGAGLYLRKQSASGSTWTLRYRFGGRDRWMALGSYPDMELSEARKVARAKRTLVDAGRDPLAAKREEIEAQLKASAARKARGKFKELAENWYETEIEGGRLKHPAVPRRYLDKYLLPEFGSTVPADISPAMAARLLARVAKKAPTAANDLLRYMRRVFRFAVRSHLITSNPVADFNLSDAGGKESARQRSLSRDELEKLFKALRDSPRFGGTNLLTIKLLLALGVRKGELLRARWREFDLDGETDTGPPLAAAGKPHQDRCAALNPFGTSCRRLAEIAAGDFQLQRVRISKEAQRPPPTCAACRHRHFERGPHHRRPWAGRIHDSRPAAHHAHAFVLAGHSQRGCGALPQPQAARYPGRLQHA